mmetsp:Transcript_14589/g.43567  ORF Transcript_14589/g.43567 Transcript_14589/m.43567 type:complete len:376 (-) Transcript_14589:33-1160(-)
MRLTAFALLATVGSALRPLRRGALGRAAMDAAADTSDLPTADAATDTFADDKDSYTEELGPVEERRPPVPRMGLGSADAPDAEAMAEAVRTAVEAYGPARRLVVDTAQNYGSEAAVGEGLRRSGRRGDAFVLCKIDLCSRAREDPAKRVARQIHRSLETMGLEYVEALVFHWPLALDQPVDADEARAIRKAAWQEAERFVDLGLVVFLGVSNFTPELLDEILAFARHKPILNEVELSPYCYQEELLEACAERNIAVVAYSPFGTCWLSVYYSDFVPWSATSCLEDATVKAIAEEVGCSPAQVLIKWAMGKDASVIPKSVKPERILEAAATPGKVQLSEEQEARLDALRDPRRGVAASLEAHERIIASDTYDWAAT